MRGSEFVFDYVQLLHCKYHKMNLNHGGSYLDPHDQIKNEKIMIIPINKREGKCFQTVVTAALNHEEIKKDLQRTTKLKTFINKCN